MKKLQPIPLVALVTGVIGAAVTIYAIHAMGNVSHGKETAGNIASAMSVVNPFAGLAGGILKSRASHYDTTVWWLLIAGIAMFLLGFGFLILYLRSPDKKE